VFSSPIKWADFCSKNAQESFNANTSKEIESNRSASLIAENAIRCFGELGGECETCKKVREMQQSDSQKMQRSEIVAEKRKMKLRLKSTQKFNS